jgi:hypothetical protein
MWKLIIFILVLLFLIASGMAVLEAWLEVRKKPKEEMFWCNKHGYFRKKHCLKLFPELSDSVLSSFVCPLCYKETVFDNPNKTLVGK